MSDDMLSVGIDIGTTTMGMVVSRLHMSNIAASYMIPEVTITKKELIYKSDLYLTPLIDYETLDGNRIKEIIEFEYKRAGIKPAQIETGAVIITGESSIKKNAEIVISSLSSFAGEFVVSTAGPDLEAIIAGKGSGAKEFSRRYGCTIANLDIGGGTTNISVFNCGDLVGQTCIDIGGRLIKYDVDRKVTYVSEKLKHLLKLNNIKLDVGDTIDENTMNYCAGIMSGVIFDSIKRSRSSFVEEVTTRTSRPLETEELIEYVSFSGGVGECFYNEEYDIFKYGDIGVALSKEIRKQMQEEDYKVSVPTETIRATVVGAGSYTTEVSGSTISYSDDVFPIKNLPIYKFSDRTESKLYEGSPEAAIQELKWFNEQSSQIEWGMCIKGKLKVTYSELNNLAECIKQIDENVINENIPLVLICENDMAKALGQVLGRKIKRNKNIICLDRVKIQSGDYIDIGKPVMNGIAVPVVLKTLIFG